MSKKPVVKEEKRELIRRINKILNYEWIYYIFIYIYMYAYRNTNRQNPVES